MEVRFWKVTGPALVLIKKAVRNHISAWIYPIGK